MYFNSILNYQNCGTKALFAFVNGVKPGVLVEVMKHV